MVEKHSISLQNKPQKRWPKNMFLRDYVNWGVILIHLLKMEKIAYGPKFIVKNINYNSEDIQQIFLYKFFLKNMFKKFFLA